MEDVRKRMAEIMELIDGSIQLTDNREELIMLACAMLQRTTELFDITIGEEGRNIMLQGVINGNQE
jgi:hypothetical protein